MDEAAEWIGTGSLAFTCSRDITLFRRTLAQELTQVGEHAGRKAFGEPPS